MLKPRKEIESDLGHENVVNGAIILEAWTAITQLILGAGAPLLERFMEAVEVAADLDPELSRAAFRGVIDGSLAEAAFAPDLIAFTRAALIERDGPKPEQGEV